MLRAIELLKVTILFLGKYLLDMWLRRRELEGSLFEDFSVYLLL